jgi:hypothetical protein
MKGVSWVCVTRLMVMSFMGSVSVSEHAPEGGANDCDQAAALAK